MYTIRIEGDIIYDDQMPNDKAYQIIDYSLKMEDNKAGSLTMIVPPTNGSFSSLRSHANMRRRVEVLADDEVIWTGRTVSVKVDIYQRLEIFCEGAMAWLCDALYQGYPAQNSTASAYKRATAMSKLNSILSGYKYIEGSTPVIQEAFRIIEGDTDMQIDGETDANYIVHGCAADTTKTCLQRLNDLVKKYGGHFECKWDQTNSINKLYWHAHEYGPNAEGSHKQTANFGENLLDYVKTVSTDDIFTVIRPYGEIADDAPSVEKAKTNLFANTNSWENQKRINVSGEVVSTIGTRFYVAHIEVQTGKTYYYTGKMLGNNSLFVVRDGSGNNMYLRTNFKGDPVDEARVRDNQNIQIPTPDGARYIYACFYDDPDYDSQHSVTVIDYSNISWVDENAELNKDMYRVTIADVYDGREYLKLSNTLFNQYGWIERRVDFSGINQPTALMNAANAYIEDVLRNGFNSITIEVNFLDLALFGVTSPLRLYDGVRVESAIGETTIMYVTKIELRKNPAQSKVTLGTVTKKGISSLV